MDILLDRIVTLVVDDNPAGLYATSKTLIREGFDVISASTGYEALQKAKEKPDVIVLDVKLPDISGFEVCRILKANPDTSNIPVIHLSATYLDDESKVQGLKMGADAYLTHPVEPKVLSATIHAMLRIRQAEAKIHAAAIKWQTTFDAINDGVCLIDLQGGINQCNMAFQNIVRVEQENLIGRKICELKGFSEFTEEYFKGLFRENLDGDREERYLENDWYLISVDSVINENGNYDGSVFKMTNITYKKKAEEKLKITMEELERSNKELEQFAYVASHDLQEPLRMISSFTQILAKRYSKNADEETGQIMNFIVEGASRMQHLIHDLLEYSRVTTKGKPFSRVNLNETIEIVLKNLQFTITEFDASIVSDQLPEITADGTQMIQLFQNLISNALKFHSDSKPEIMIKSEDKDREWFFSISDNGIGIDPQFYQRIFEIFQRLHDRTEYSGTGIGLAICKKIIERHKGRIWVNSEAGKGTTFYFTLPRSISN
ncbi:MAG: ATP-binding protein [Ignavibacteriales bacterium]